MLQLAYLNPHILLIIMISIMMIRCHFVEKLKNSLPNAGKLAVDVE